MTAGSDEWCTELERHRDLVQDGDTSVAPEEASHRFRRYVELVDMVTGAESQPTFQAIIDSIVVENDYGAYEAVHNALWRFPPEKFAEYMVAALPAFIRRMGRHDQVARFLCPLSGHGQATYLPAFNKQLACAPDDARAYIMAFVREHQDWFGDNHSIGDAS